MKYIVGYILVLCVLGVVAKPIKQAQVTNHEVSR